MLSDVLIKLSSPSGYGAISCCSVLQSNLISPHSPACEQSLLCLFVSYLSLYLSSVHFHSYRVSTGRVYYVPDVFSFYIFVID